MPLQATSGAASYDAFGGGVPAVPNYIEDVFSTYLYTGTGAAQTITNNIDLSTKGGLTWIKSRTDASDHSLEDTLRTVSIYAATINSNTTAAQSAGDITAFTTSGFSLRDYTGTTNSSGTNYASWTFRKQPKFFDVVTYSGSNSNQTINHNLGSAPGCIMIKKLDSNTFDAGWAVYHRSLTNPNNYSLVLNSTAAETNYGGAFISSVSSTTFTVAGNAGEISLAGSTYVAYLFAHNAGGFGLTGTDNVISCGSFTIDGSGKFTANLGYEPQWIMIKLVNGTSNWSIFDNMRGMPVGSPTTRLLPNTSDAESSAFSFVDINATGFAAGTGSGNPYSEGQNWIYVAIRRGPMKVPTSGTDVFLPKTRTGNGTTGTVVTGASWPMDMLWISRRTGGGAGVGGFTDIDRLRGAYLGGNNPLLRQNQTDAESTSFVAPGFVGGQTSYDLPGGSGYGLFNTNAVTYVDYLFRRSPSFFDEVCYTGTSTDPQNYSHNLQAVPEMMIVRRRNQDGNYWFCFHKNLTAGHILQLESTAGSASDTSIFTTTAPTASVFTVGGDSGVNSSSGTYVAYLFATCAGVSKVGSYTGNGSTQTINCGFTGGARFVLIKRTDSTGDWMVSDSARGIVSGNDPYLELNNTNAEVTGEDWLDTDSTGFVVNEVSGSNANTNGASYIFLAIA